MLYQTHAPGDWGVMQTTSQSQTATETLTMADGCTLFLRSWRTESQDVLLLMHGLGAHSGWFIDMGNELAARGLSVYAVDHRGFGRSGGVPGHVERFDTYVADLAAVLKELRERHTVNGQRGRLYVLGHSMGGIFATHLAARHGELLNGVLFLNPWVRDSSKVSLGMTLGVFGGGLLHSKRLWRTPGGIEGMTTNPEAVRMLEADPYWRRDLTANFLLQIFRMRLQVLKLARSIHIPALVMQAEQDKAVMPAATRTLYEALTSSDKTWKAYPDYAHDTELEVDRTQLDRDIVEWIQARSQTS
ncbi:MAG TPA: alpha/beta hydrolase [Ktedonobacteraceae bacterium]|nr:alpha/beta hydrolase [Ktedonobacteraceae bacterium]